jgi:catechol 2,3-dioxygenase-like lactoylglutathione lyase family enzyme
MSIETTLAGLTLHVHDAEASREFYMRIPGFRLAGHRPGEFVLLEIGGGLLGLLQMPRAGFHIEIGCNGLDDLHTHLVRQGIKPASRPRERPWGERTFNVVDPDGNVLEFQDG